MQRHATHQDVEAMARELAMTADTIDSGIRKMLAEHPEIPQGVDEHTGYGKCYDTTFFLVLLAETYAELAGRLVLCHGMVWNPAYQQWAGHAWLEDVEGRVAIDFSNSNDAVVPRELYYAVGQCWNVARYGVDRAREEGQANNSPGPWHFTQEDEDAANA